MPEFKVKYVRGEGDEWDYLRACGTTRQSLPILSLHVVQTKDESLVQQYVGRLEQQDEKNQQRTRWSTVCIHTVEQNLDLCTCHLRHTALEEVDFVPFCVKYLRIIKKKSHWGGP